LLSPFESSFRVGAFTFERTIQRELYEPLKIPCSDIQKGDINRLEHGQADRKLSPVILAESGSATKRLWVVFQLDHKITDELD
jgi:hypothetical protein